MLDKLKKEIQESANEKQAEILQRFFKTGKGGYGEGDVFLGLNSQQIKNIAKKFFSLSIPKIQELLKSKIHEERVCALRILIRKYENASNEEQENIFNFYLSNTKNINNWDLVDLSAPKIFGSFLLNHNKNLLYKLVQSENLWERRIAIISTLSFIRENEFEDTLAISELLLQDNHDLIHKAVGWMLREVGKREKNILKDFLRKHYENIPRTTLRYAIEKFEEEERKKWLRGDFG
jgi:3-methyladenine DNA glycosylase AlkD